MVGANVVLPLPRCRRKLTVLFQIPLTGFEGPFRGGMKIAKWKKGRGRKGRKAT